MADLQPTVEAALRAHELRYQVVACDPTLADTAAFCEFYHFAPEQAANTIIVAGKADPAVYCACVVLATTRLDVNKKVCQLLGVKKASFASAEQTMALSGMMIGGVTVFGIKDMPIYVDSAVMAQPQIIMGGGNRSSKVLLDPRELEKLPAVQVIDHLAQPRAA